MKSEEKGEKSLGYIGLQLGYRQEGKQSEGNKEWRGREEDWRERDGRGENNLKKEGNGTEAVWR